MVHVYSKKECQKHTEKDFKDIQSSSTLTKYEHKWVMRRVALTITLTLEALLHIECAFYFVYSIFTLHNSHRWGPPRGQDMFLSSLFFNKSPFLVLPFNKL